MADLNVTKLLDAAVSGIGGHSRPGQVRMAQAVDKALKNGTHLAVQAGTGTGKSLAYLIPAIMSARDSSQPVIISTATIALQKQLIDRDLPRVRAALADILDPPPSFAILKGRSNYLCRYKLDRASSLEDSLDTEDTPISELGAASARVFAWAEETETGDRDSLEPGVPDLIWRQFSVSAQECMGASRCPFGEECFAEYAKKEAAESEIVVTNHAMLAINAIFDVPVLPDHDVVIVDEAHELTDRFTAMSTQEISTHAFDLSLNRAAKLGSGVRDEKLASAVEDWEKAMGQIPLGRLVDLPEALKPSLDAIVSLTGALITSIGTAPPQESTNDPERYAERQNVKMHLESQREAIIRILDVFEEPDITQHKDVVWLTEDERGRLSMHIAPLSVSHALALHLFSNHTVILTSATLTLGGNFKAMAASWGVPKHSWRGLDVGTPFDPAHSGILYLPTHLPEPSRDGLADAIIDEIYDLIMAAGGRSLGLFSSKRAAVQAADALRHRLPFKVLCQGEDSTGALIKTFSKEENSCLFGTLSLWQGVDVPGSSCSLVIMDKIPFPRPDDPLLQARKEAADAAGRNGFMEVAAAHAALLMAQGAGRLLRATSDRGVVACLDPRLSSKRYGSFLISSMPAFWRTHKKETVIAALGRLVQHSTTQHNSSSPEQSR
ncbi:ATP-dependent DNA helicase [Corynebacterium sp. ES2794-CONJ1]|uniref:ATP-dependent DNA helicase n=1 Tax=unclassified Corynebacterium TaxID=2624378 RepID=UPI002167DA7B|nr:MULTISPECIES: ATP-dependent DNA helicase [unclassified Corynebacterium]MCS4492447.1 ATP-dependent DNA helicase [Corynebacterium sp. ES2715-CONJ3]MCU9519984.1 ATP-dependent DNA helicase [Corynebacterium sp. ES2794-CONJ1]